MLIQSTSLNNPLTTIPPTIPPRVYNVRAYIGPKEYSRTIMNDLTVK